MTSFLAEDMDKDGGVLELGKREPSSVDYPVVSFGKKIILEMYAEILGNLFCNNFFLRNTVEY